MLLTPPCPPRAFWSCVTLAAAVAAVGGCDKRAPSVDGETATDGTAEVILALRETPRDVRCVSIQIATDRTDRRRFDVERSSSSSFKLHGLPVGVAIFTVEAFDKPCAAIDERTLVTWAGGPKSVTLKPGRNGTIEIAMERPVHATVTLTFGEGHAPTCAPGGSACVTGADCCSKSCAVDRKNDGTSNASVGTCRVDEPPAPTGSVPTHDPSALEPDGNASYPGFDGDWFYVAFPAVADPANEDARASRVRQRYLGRAMRAIGFQRPEQIALAPEAPQRLPGGNFDNLVDTICASDVRDNATNASVCQVLRRYTTPCQQQSDCGAGGAGGMGMGGAGGAGGSNPGGPPAPAAGGAGGGGAMPPVGPDAGSDGGAADSSKAAVDAGGMAGGGETPGGAVTLPTETWLQTALGMPMSTLVQEINRPLDYWVFSQRVGGYTVEHKGIVAVRHVGQRVSAVYGSVVSNTRIVNAIGLNPQAAFVRGYAQLLKVEKAVGQMGSAPESDTVALPYGAPADDPGGKTTALRIAYRMKVIAARPAANRAIPLAFTVWLDAATGDLLKYSALSRDAELPSRPVTPWCRDPSDTPEQCLVRIRFEPEALMKDGVLRDNYFEIIGGHRARLTPHLPGAAGPANYEVERCRKDSGFRQTNVFAHLSRFRTLVQEGGKLPSFGDRIKVHVDEGLLDENAANYQNLTLSFIQGTLDDSQTSACTFGSTSGVLNGSQDATIIAHEFAHLATMHLQLGKQPGTCGDTPCPLSNPYNRTFFHDYADAYAALLTDSPCIGGWIHKNTPVRTLSGGVQSRPGNSGASRKEVTSACAFANEGSKLPRLLHADFRPGQLPTVGLPTAQQERALRLEARKSFEGQEYEYALFGDGDDPRYIPDVFPAHRHAASEGDYADGQILGAALWHTWQGLRSANQLVTSTYLWGRLNEAVFETGFSPTICPPGEVGCDSNVYRAGRELLTFLTGTFMTSAGRKPVNKLLSGFARAGIFLAPPACIDGDLLDPNDEKDPQHCPEGNSGADAIVDIDDNELTPTDGVAIDGIMLADDDFIAEKPTFLPKFRVWTGPAYRVSTSALDPKTIPTDELCNDRFQVYVRLPGVANAVRVSQELQADNCYGEWQLNQGDWDRIIAAMPNNAPAAFEYEAITWRSGSGNRAKTERSSLRPGNRHWQGTPQAPAFFIDDDGMP